MGWLTTWRRHLPEYAIEAALLGVFMLSACGFTVLLEHPASPIHRLIDDPSLRRVPMGLAMGLTAVALIFSPWGQRSGAHLNPATTLAFWRLGKITSADAVAYGAVQTAGAIAGTLLAGLLLGDLVRHPAVQFAVTVPGMAGVAAAFAAEAAMTALLLTVVLHAANTPRLARWTGLFAGALVAAYIAIEAPLSGMSLNPARSLASAVGAGIWTDWWLYLTAPPLGMLLAAEVWHRRHGAPICAKLHHANGERCIFRCGYAHPAAAAQPHHLTATTAAD